MTIEQVAQTLHVTPRTVRYWFSGHTTVPFAAYKLMRILGRFELPAPFGGWHIHSGKLWTPEGHGIEPRDGDWWSLLVRQAQCFRALYQRSGEFERALMRLASTAYASADSPIDRVLTASDLPHVAAGSSEPATDGARSDRPGPARRVPTGKAGRAAEPPGLNLFKGHIATYANAVLPREHSLTSGPGVSP